MVERRWSVADFFLLNLNSKKMEKQQTNQQATTTEQNTVMMKQIKETPFLIHENEGKKYISCGKVLMELDEGTDTEQLEKQLQGIPWEPIGVFCQAICAEMIKENNENIKK